MRSDQTRHEDGTSFDGEPDGTTRRTTASEPRKRLCTVFSWNGFFFEQPSSVYYHSLVYLFLSQGHLSHELVAPINPLTRFFVLRNPSPPVLDVPLVHERLVRVKRVVARGEIFARAILRSEH